MRADSRAESQYSERQREPGQASVDAVKRCGICARTLEPNLNILKDSGSRDRRGGFACNL